MRDSYFLLLNKPKGITSQKLLTQVKKNLPKKTKVGHHGTLDPFASGLMLVGVGEACKFFQFIDDTKKTYVATLKLGIETNTLDNTGEIVLTQDVDSQFLTQDSIQSTFKSFLGKSLQTPPMFSAIKIAGKRLYKLAREGKEVERKPREIEIFDLNLLDIDLNNKTIEFEVTCSRGAYIRSLALDIAKKLNTIGHLEALTRTKLVGKTLNDAFSLYDEGRSSSMTKVELDSTEPYKESYDEGKKSEKKSLLTMTKVMFNSNEWNKIPIESLLTRYKKLTLNDEQKLNMFHGKKLVLKEILSEYNDGEIISLFDDHQFLGMGRLAKLDYKNIQIESLRLINSQLLGLDLFS